MHNHYIRLEGNKVIKGFSDAFEEPQEGDILIAENAGRHFEYDGQVNPPLSDEDGIPAYKYAKNKMGKRTKAEIEADRKALPAPEPSEMERLKGDVERLILALEEKDIITKQDLDRQTISR